MSETTRTAQLMDTYVKLRDAKAKLEAIHKEKLKPINAAMDGIEKELMGILKAQGVTSTATANRTAFIDPKVSYKIEDWEALQEFIDSQPAAQRYYYLERRPAKDAIEAYLEDNGKLPPGVVSKTFEKLAVRRK